jgi:TolA-binding protein
MSDGPPPPSYPAPPIPSFNTPSLVGGPPFAQDWNQLPIGTAQLRTSVLLDQQRRIAQLEEQLKRATLEIDKLQNEVSQHQKEKERRQQEGSKVFLGINFHSLP